MVEAICDNTLQLLMELEGGVAKDLIVK